MWHLVGIICMLFLKKMYSVVYSEAFSEKRISIVIQPTLLQVVDLSWAHRGRNVRLDTWQRTLPVVSEGHTWKRKSCCFCFLMRHNLNSLIFQVTLYCKVPSSADSAQHFPPPKLFLFQCFHKRVSDSWNNPFEVCPLCYTCIWFTLSWNTSLEFEVVIFCESFSIQLYEKHCLML